MNINEVNYKKENEAYLLAKEKASILDDQVSTERPYYEVSAASVYAGGIQYVENQKSLILTKQIFFVF